MEPIPTANHPLPSLASLQLQYVGKKLEDLPTPAVVLDRAVVKKNCNAMLDVCDKLGVGFRAHVKSHKAGLPSCRTREHVLYGVPPAQCAIPRLLHLSSILAPGSLNILIDNIDAFNKMSKALVEGEIGVFIKIDTGYKRAGIKISSSKFPGLVRKVVGTVGETFRGFYSHYGHSYAGSSEKDAAHGLISELEGLEEAAAEVDEVYLRLLKSKMVLTVGATPTATAAQNMLSGSPRAAEFKTLLNRLKETK
ncbi:hypothetical protein SLS60_006660 [Paraconiothyrium brasiliense]|uniref:Alanine racemase N-terminal domain-containing protein n=1 Tax=Paraconiothyrium brasiliense TaxID=300254 RepID=A0ABR3RBD2_9PLEO